jgi:calcineurin-like phosphoesterase family protein
MSNIWFTSDLHFGHDREFIWGPRGFKSVYEMNETIIENWRNTVKYDDDIYVLGDLMLGNEDNIKLIKTLKGNIHIVRGNHCTNERMKLYAQCWNVVEITEGQFFKYKGQNFYLSHYPCLTSNYNTDKPLKARVINLCGHTHTTDKFLDMDKGLIYHVELDAHNNKPVLIDNILNDINEYLKRR